MYFLGFQSVKFLRNYVTRQFFTTYMAVQSFVGLHNSGNTCFLAAGTNIAIGLKENSRLVKDVNILNWMCVCMYMNTA